MAETGSEDPAWPLSSCCREAEPARALPFTHYKEALLVPAKKFSTMQTFPKANLERVCSKVKKSFISLAKAAGRPGCKNKKHRSIQHDQVIPEWSNVIKSYL